MEIEPGFIALLGAGVFQAEVRSVLKGSVLWRVFEDSSLATEASKW